MIFGQGTSAPSLKKGDRRQCQNYRGICVQSTVSRIIGRLVRDKLESEYTTPVVQTGFTPGSDHAWIIFLCSDSSSRNAVRRIESSI